METVNPLEREQFWSLVDKREPGECWPWKGTLDANGYGSFRVGGKARAAHRLAYTDAVGPIPKGLVIDHVWARGCTRTDCQNPNHLEPVTIAENTRRGFSPAAVSHRTNLCRNGHELVGDNVIVGTNGNRQCRTCRNAKVVEEFHAANPDAVRYKTGVCKRGHEKSPDDVGGCRACKYLTNRRRRERDQAARP